MAEPEPGKLPQGVALVLPGHAARRSRSHRRPGRGHPRRVGRGRMLLPVPLRRSTPRTGWAPKVSREVGRRPVPLILPGEGAATRGGITRALVLRDRCCPTERCPPGVAGRAVARQRRLEEAPSRPLERRNAASQLQRSSAAHARAGDRRTAVDPLLGVRMLARSAIADASCDGIPSPVSLPVAPVRRSPRPRAS